MNATYAEEDGKPAVTHLDHVNLGPAVDAARRDPHPPGPQHQGGRHPLLRRVHRRYEVIGKVTENKLSPDDFAGTSITITNPGTVGTVQSVPA